MARLYNSFRIRLPREVLAQLVPLLGNPSYNKRVDGCVYTGISPTDYILHITLWNGTSTVTVNVLCVDSKEILRLENVYSTRIGGIQEAGGLP